MDNAEHFDQMRALYGNRQPKQAQQRDDRIERLRVPPHSIEAEQAVIGGLMLDPQAWWKVVDVVQSGDFYRRDHALIFTAISDMVAKKQPFDAVTLADWFDSQGLSEQIAGGAYLVELASSTPSAANVRAYADIVADKARMRKIIEAGTIAVNNAFQSDGRSGTELLGEAISRFSALLSTEPCELESLAPVMSRVWDRLEERSRAEVGIHGMTTGISELDALLGGLKPGGLYILAARPKMGKTTLAQNIAEHVALRMKQPVAFFSFEMQPEELGDRMLSSIGNIDGNRVRSGEFDEFDWTNATQAMNKLRSAEIFVSKPRSARVEHVVAQTRRQHAAKPLGLVVIDYLQLMAVQGDNRAQGLGDITRALKLMAGELGLPILLLSQLSRDLEKRPDKRPMPSDLRDSGAIEQDADAVVFIYRDEIYDKASRYKGTAELIVALQRNGAPGDVRVLYTPSKFKFQDLPEYWQPEPMPTKDDKPFRPRGFKSSKKPQGFMGGDE